MTTLWLFFLLGLTTGSAGAWLLPAFTRPHRSLAYDGWTVAAIASRIERENAHQRSESPAVRTRHNGPHPTPHRGDTNRIHAQQISTASPASTRIRFTNPRTNSVSKRVNPPSK
ncbi:hypothetical protein ACWEOI_31070 [Nocardia sp. NPDC004340]